MALHVPEPTSRRNVPAVAAFDSQSPFVFSFVPRCRRYRAASLYHRAVSLDRFHALHLERDRAESFGSVAEQYDRYRPAFPDALLDDLAVMAGSTEVLDVGSGTGKVARGLAQRGLSVLGVELDPRMVAVARGHGIDVEVAPFETWDDAGRRFDLVTCGDAWHWIEPRRGAEKVAHVLRPRGAFVRFWNVQLLDEPVMAALDVVFTRGTRRKHASTGVVPPYESCPPTTRSPSMARSPSSMQRRTSPERRASTGEDWAGVLPGRSAIISACQESAWRYYARRSGRQSSTSARRSACGSQRPPCSCAVPDLWWGLGRSPLGVERIPLPGGVRAPRVQKGGG